MDLETYKNYLIGYFFHSCDNNKQKRQQRENAISRYSDEYLLNIVTNTAELFEKILLDMNNDRKTQKSNIYYLLEFINSFHIHSACTGGWCPDMIINLDEGQKKQISLYLLKRLFGKCFHIDITYDEIEDYNEEEEVMSVYTIQKLYIVGKTNDFDLLYKNHLYKRLTKALRRRTTIMNNK
ncbi:MAG: hypothetical protein PHE54_01200 [Bacilli bacterium]|nr:hypothetical protein [Bacilli bacterium]